MMVPLTYSIEEEKANQSSKKKDKRVTRNINIFSSFDNVKKD
jgi:hypothetical protein